MNAEQHLVWQRLATIKGLAKYFPWIPLTQEEHWIQGFFCGYDLRDVPGAYADTGMVEKNVRIFQVHFCNAPDLIYWCGYKTYYCDDETISLEQAMSLYAGIVSRLLFV